MTKAISTTRDDASLRRRLKGALRRIKEAVIKIDEWTEYKSTHSEVAVGLGLRLRPEGEKLIVPVEVEGSKYEAHFIEPEAGERWKVDEIVEYLRDAGRYDEFTSSLFDIEKFEAAVASGSVPKTLANKFKEPTKPSAPHFRFYKA